MSLDVLAAEETAREEQLQAMRDFQPQEILLGYQQRASAAVSHNSLTVVEKSRRIGLTWGTASDAVLTAAAQRAAGGMDVFYIAFEKEMTREFIDTAATWSKYFGMVASDVSEFMWKDDDEAEGILAFRIMYASGFEIVALSSSPRGLRGRQGMVIVDEAAFHDDLDELLKAALALLMWGGRVVVISTHNGVTNPFNVLINDIRSGKRPGEVLTITLDDALRDGLYKRICQRSGNAWSPAAEAEWRRSVVAFYADAADEELFCIPRNAAGQYLPRPLIEARMEAGIPVLRWTPPAPDFVDWPDSRRREKIQRLLDEIDAVLATLPKNARCYLGGDFGRSGDLSVLWLLMLMPDLVRRTPLVIELRQMPFADQRLVLFHVLDHLPIFEHGKFDATGIGAQISEETRQRYGQARVEEVKLSIEWYRVNMPPMKSAFEGSGIIVPRDNEILADFELIVFDKGVAQIGTVRTKGKTGQRHGDSAVAAVLCHAASRSTVRRYAYDGAAAAPAGSGRDRDRDVNPGNGWDSEFGRPAFGPGMI